MGHRPPQELLLELRTYLQHFDQTGYLGASDTVAEIKRRILDRIAEVEACLRLAQSDPPRTIAQPHADPTRPKPPRPALILEKRLRA